MVILAVETSCDETSCAIVRNGTEILANTLSSSSDLHIKMGGIIPEIAAREQVRCIIPVIEEALTKLDLNKDIDALAVTIGPGLTGSLLIGVETVKTLGFVFEKKIIPVNHILAHIYSNWLFDRKPEFPAIALVVSGGHTELFYMESHDKIHWIGGTLDDAAGEAFDKTARLLGLGYPGGPAIAKAASKLTTHNSQPITRLPRPIIDSGDLNFSFSGLKTAVLKEIRKLKTTEQLNNETINYLSYEIQEAITDVLVDKTIKAAIKYKVNSILLGGGVAANNRLSQKFRNAIPNSQLITHNTQLFIPPPSLCTDNAAYIGSYAFFHQDLKNWEEINASADLNIEV